MHGAGRYLSTNRHRDRFNTRANRDLERRSQRHHKREQLDTDLVGHQRDLVPCKWRLERRHAGERIAIHGRADGEHDLYADLHRRWGQRVAVGDRVGQHSGPDHHDYREPQHD